MDPLEIIRCNPMERVNEQMLQRLILCHGTKDHAMWHSEGVPLSNIGCALLAVNRINHWKFNNPLVLFGNCLQF